MVSSLLRRWQGCWTPTPRQWIPTDPAASWSSPPFIGPSAIGPSAKERLADAGISCADATGNLRLVASRPAVFIETEGAVRNPWRENVPLPSLQGRRSGRVVRAFLDHRPPYGTRELAALSDNAPSSNSRMTEWWTARSMAAAVAMGLAKVRSHYEKTRLDVISKTSVLSVGHESERGVFLAQRLGDKIGHIRERGSAIEKSIHEMVSRNTHSAIARTVAAWRSRCLMPGLSSDEIAALRSQ